MRSPEEAEQDRVGDCCHSCGASSGLEEAMSLTCVRAGNMDSCMYGGDDGIVRR